MSGEMKKNQLNKIKNKKLNKNEKLLKREEKFQMKIKLK